MSMNNHGKLGVIIALSIVMVGATVAIAVPNIVEAAPKHIWCYTAASIVCSGSDPADLFDNKKECKDHLAAFEAGNPGIATQPCEKRFPG